MKHLPEIVLGIAIFVALAAIGIGLWLSNARNPFGPPPRIEMQLGDDWTAIQKNSDYPFRNSPTSSSGNSTDFEPVAFVYNDPTHRLSFPETNGIYFQMVDNHVTEIRLLQYGKQAARAQTEPSLRALISDVERAGWQPTHSRGSLEQVITRTQQYYDDPKNNNFMNDQFLDSWTIQGARLDLSLYRNHTAGDTVNGQTLPASLYTIYLIFKRVG